MRKVSEIQLPGSYFDLVATILQQGAKRGFYDFGLVKRIEETVKECLEKWTPDQRRSIWLGAEAGLRRAPILRI